MKACRFFYMLYVGLFLIYVFIIYLLLLLLLLAIFIGQINSVICFTYISYAADCFVLQLFYKLDFNENY